MKAFLNRSLLVVLMIVTVSSHTRLIRALSSDGENSITEGETLFALKSVRQGRTLYHDFSHPPYVLTQYTPLFYLVPGKLAGWLGKDVLGTFTIGRGYAYLCWLGIAALIYALARQHLCPRVEATLGALVFLCAPLTVAWANSYRPDSAAVFFSLLAIFVYRRGWWLAAAVALAIAFLHKQSAVVALAVIGWQELRERRWRLAVVWAMLVGAVLWWGGKPLAMNCFGSLAQFHDWRWPAYLLGGSLLMGAAGFTGGVLALRVSSGSLLKRYFLLSLAFAFVTSAKFGSWTNYYIEPLAVGCALTPIWLSERAHYRLVHLAWLAVALVSAAETWRQDALNLHRQDRRTSLDAIGAPLLIEDTYLAARSEQTPYLLNPGIFARLETAGRWDGRNLRQAILEGQFAAIVCLHPLDSAVAPRPFPPAWRALMREHYRREEQILPDLWVYRP